MARRPVAGAARLGSVRLFVDGTVDYQTRARPLVELLRGPRAPAAAAGCGKSGNALVYRRARHP